MNNRLILLGRMLVQQYVDDDIMILKYCTVVLIELYYSQPLVVQMIQQRQKKNYGMIGTYLSRDVSLEGRFESFPYVTSEVVEL